MAGDYLATPATMICPTTPDTSYFTGALSNAVNPFNRSPTANSAWDIHWNQPTSTSAAPMGTYFYFGGLSEDNKAPAIYFWNQNKNRELRSINVLQPSNYAIAADFDGTRNTTSQVLTLEQRTAMNPHSRTKGKSYSWFDGHVSFLPPATEPLNNTDIFQNTPALTQEGVYFRFYGTGALESIQGTQVNTQTIGPGIRRILRIPS